MKGLALMVNRLQDIQVSAARMNARRKNGCHKNGHHMIEHVVLQEESAPIRDGAHLLVQMRQPIM
jgi:hypothetical protein